LTLAFVQQLRSVSLSGKDPREVDQALAPLAERRLVASMRT